MVQFYKSLLEDVVFQNKSLENEVETMIALNKQNEVDSGLINEAIKREEDKTARLMLQMEVLKETYESKMNEILANRKEELMD